MDLINSIKNKKHVILGILLVIIIGIVYYKIVKTDKPFYSHSRAIIGKKILIPDSLGFPYGILYFANKIIVLDKRPVNGINQISIYNVNKFDRISSFGRSGSGPGEFRSVSSIARSIKDKNIITIWDGSLLRLSIIDIFDSSTVKLKNIYPLKRGMSYSPVLIDDSTIVCLGKGFLEGRFAFLDTTGSIKKYLGVPLPGRNPTTPMPVHQQAMIGKLKVTPDGSKFIITAHLSDMIDIYDNKGKLLKRIIGPLNVTPKYTIGTVGDNEPVMIIDSKNAMMGYADVALTNDKIFALFVGSPFEGNQLEGKEIHVFNMKGELLETIILDHKLFSISYDEKNKMLYGTQISSIPAIYMYQL